MKQKIYVVGVINTLVIFSGTIFKINHFPGAGILLTLGLASLVLLFIPLALINNFRVDKMRQNLALYIVTFITCLIVFTAMLFKIQHWPYSGALLVIALPFPYIVFLPVFLRTTSKNRNIGIYSVVFVLSLLALNSVFSVLLALNVSKARIDDSYNISKNYLKMEEALKPVTENPQQSEVDRKLDEVIKTVSEYQSLILQAEGSSIEKWKDNPENLLRPDTRGIGAQVLAVSGNEPVAGRLSNGLKNLIIEMSKTRGYENIAKAAPAIFDFNYTNENDQEWVTKVFQNNSLSWTLMYLDGLKTNLLLIRASSHKDR